MNAPVATGRDLIVIHERWPRLRERYAVESNMADGVLIGAQHAHQRGVLWYHDLGLGDIRANRLVRIQVESAGLLVQKPLPGHVQLLKDVLHIEVVVSDTPAARFLPPSIGEVKFIRRRVPTCELECTMCAW